MRILLTTIAMLAATAGCGDTTSTVEIAGAPVMPTTTTSTTSVDPPPQTTTTAASVNDELSAGVSFSVVEQGSRFREIDGVLRPDEDYDFPGALSFTYNGLVVDDQSYGYAFGVAQAERGDGSCHEVLVIDGTTNIRVVGPFIDPEDSDWDSQDDDGDDAPLSPWPSATEFYGAIGVDVPPAEAGATDQTIRRATVGADAATILNQYSRFGPQLEQGYVEVPPVNGQYVPPTRPAGPAGEVSAELSTTERLDGMLVRLEFTVTHDWIDERSARRVDSTEVVYEFAPLDPGFERRTLDDPQPDCPLG